MKIDPDTLVSRAEGSIASSVFTDDESGIFSLKYLADASAYDLLQEDEQIHYLLITGSNSVEIQSNTSSETETVTPDTGLRGVVAVTDQRILIAIGRRGGDRVIELEPADVTSAKREGGLLSTKIVFETTEESVNSAGPNPRKTYLVSVKKRKSSDADGAVEYVREQFIPVTTDEPEDGTKRAELRANGGFSTSTEAADVIDTELVENAKVVPEKALQQLAEAVGTVRNLDLEETKLNEAISALETARDQLSSVADERGLSTEVINRAIVHVESTLESLEDIRTVKARADRKLVLIDNGNEVSNSTLTELLDSIEDAKDVAGNLGLGTEGLDERQESLAEQLDGDGSAESENGADDPEQTSGVADSEEWEWAGENESDESPTDSPPESSTTSGGTGAPDELPNDPSREDLIEELHRVESEIGKTPTPIYVRKYGRYDKQVFLHEFGNWDRVLNIVTDDGSEGAASDGTGPSESAAGETVQPTASSSGTTTADAGSSSGGSSEPSREAVLADIERVSDQLGRRPKLSEYGSRGSNSQSDVYRHFDSWADAVDASDVDTASRTDLITELERLESELGFPPQTSHIGQHGKYTPYAYNQEFGSVDEALAEAGFDIEAHVRETITELAAESAGKLRMSEFKEQSPYSANVIYKYWDSWGDALDDLQSQESRNESSGNQSESLEEDSDAEPEVVHNKLSELYEQIRNLRTLCGAVVDASEDADDDTDGSSPMSAWLENLESFPGQAFDEAEAYGAQQRDRNPFSMREYREQFGNGDRVTEFVETDARQPIAAVRGLLDDSIDGDPSEFYLPVDSQTGASFPMVVESQSELDRAVQMLERLPERPASANASTDPESGMEDGTETPVPTTSRSSSHSTAGVDSLTEVNGVTEQIAEALTAKGYKSADDLKDASIDELAAVDAIGRQIALRIKLNVSD